MSHSSQTEISDCTLEDIKGVCGVDPCDQNTKFRIKPKCNTRFIKQDCEEFPRHPRTEIGDCTLEDIKKACGVDPCDQNTKIRINPGNPNCDVRIRSGCGDFSPCTQNEIKRVVCSSSSLQRCDEGGSFTSNIVPLSDLMGTSTHLIGSVEFKMRRKNKTVTLQWESFYGVLTASGVTHLTVLQSISNLPPYVFNSVLFLRHRGIPKISTLEIDPSEKNSLIKIFINPDRTETNIMMGDHIFVAAGSATWIID